MPRLRATAFVLTSLETGQLLGSVVLCPSAGYATLAKLGTSRRTRLSLSASQWKEVEAELAVGLPGGPLPRASAIAVALTQGSASVMIQYLRQDEMDIERPELASGRLDRLLEEVAPPASP